MGGSSREISLGKEFLYVGMPRDVPMVYSMRKLLSHGWFINCGSEVSSFGRWLPHEKTGLHRCSSLRRHYCKADTFEGYEGPEQRNMKVTRALVEVHLDVSRAPDLIVV